MSFNYFARNFPINRIFNMDEVPYCTDGINNYMSFCFDSFKALLTDFVSIQIENLKVDTVPIPGGYTSCKQPLDVSINSPAKNRYIELWAIFMDSQCMCGENDCAHMFTPAGNRKKPHDDQRAQMESDAMKHFNEKAVRNSFKTCGLNFKGD